MNNVDAHREKALLILTKVFENKSYSNILIKNLKQDFSQLDRAFITEIVYGTIKWRLRIDNVINQLSRVKMSSISPYILNILRIGIYQIDFMSRVPNSAAVDECVKLAKKYSNIGAARFVNALLRNYLRKHESISYPNRDKDIVGFLSVYYSYPEWMVSRLVDELGEAMAEDFMKSSNDAPPVTVRVNNLKTTKSELKNSLLDKGIDVSDGKYMDDALILRNVPGIEGLDEYRKGYLTVQDESSMLSVKVLSPKSGEFIMDVCSAPGTKSTYMAEMMNNNGTIIAGDIVKSKLRLVDENASRLGVKIINSELRDASKPNEAYIGKADRVLIDAPCSGLGIMRKKPEIRWNRMSQDIEEICAMQRSILDASSKYVKPDGVLVYSTCTVLREENIDMIRDFIKRNGRFVLEDITGLVPGKLKKDNLKDGYIELFPNIDGIDGFFIARLRRVE